MKDSIIETNRDRLGITVTALAKRMDVSRPQIYNWINKTSQPNATQISQLSKILGVTVKAIVDDFIKEETLQCDVSSCKKTIKEKDSFQARYDYTKRICESCHDDGN